MLCVICYTRPGEPKLCQACYKRVERDLLKDNIAMKEHSTKCKTRDVNFAAGNIIPRECDCDGYHTFDELYDHRITLYITVCMLLRLHTNLPVWRSKRHSDGEICFGTGTQFVLGISEMKGRQITYHIPIERWDETTFALTYEKAPEWDGHTSDDVIKRLKTL